MSSISGASATEKRHLPTGMAKDRDGAPHKRAKSANRTEDDNAPRGRFYTMFENFRDELDEHYDRKERIVKASRDVTALSKKM